MSPLVNFSQVHLASFCLISSHFLSTLARLLQESSPSLHALFLFLYSASWLMSHTPLLREQSLPSTHGERFKRGTWTGGSFTWRDKVGEWAPTCCQSQQTEGEKSKSQTWDREEQEQEWSVRMEDGRVNFRGWAEYFFDLLSTWSCVVRWELLTARALVH